MCLLLIIFANSLDSDPHRIGGNKNINTIEECRSNIFRYDWRQMAIKTLFLAIIDLRLLIVKSVFDCRLSGVRLGSNLHARDSNGIPEINSLKKFGI